MQVRQIALNAAFGAATRSAQAMDATGAKADRLLDQPPWLLAGVALFALQSSAAATLPRGALKGIARTITMRRTRHEPSRTAA